MTFLARSVSRMKADRPGRSAERPVSQSCTGTGWWPGRWVPCWSSAWRGWRRRSAGLHSALLAASSPNCPAAARSRCDVCMYVELCTVGRAGSCGRARSGPGLSSLPSGRTSCRRLWTSSAAGWPRRCGYAENIPPTMKPDSQPMISMIKAAVN